MEQDVELNKMFLRPFGRRNKEVDMEWSRYNYFFKSPKHGNLLYNTLTQALIKIPEGDLDRLLRLQQMPDDVVNMKEKDFFLSRRFIVKSNNDELAYHINRVLKNRYNPSSMSLTIAVTRACNFNCVYCYEDDRVNKYMNEAVEEDVVNFVKRNPHLKSLFVVWYGGEPLLNFQSIKRLSRAFISLEIEYNAFIVTNGYLLTEEIIAQFSDLRIGGVQITLDGEEKFHDSRRMLRGGGKTFEVIIRNIETLLEIAPKVRIDIRTNIDRRNSMQYTAFYREIREKFPQKNIRVYTGFSHDLLGSGCVPSDVEMSTANDRAGFFLKNFDENKLPIVDFSFHTQLTTCIANNLTGFVVGPEGEVYKCWTVIGCSDVVIGNIKDPNKFDQTLIARYMTGADYLFDEKCRECTCLPICTGGCPLDRIRSKYENIKIDFCSVARQNLESYIERSIEVKNLKRR